MTTTKKKVGRPATLKKEDFINVSISRGAYDVISKEAKLQRRTFRATLDYIVGV